MRKRLRLTTAEIAERANVSSATVSRVLNKSANVKPEIAQRVLHVLVEAGINPDSVISPILQQGKLLLLTLPFDFNSFFNEIIRGAKASAVQHGYQLLILQEHINENTFPAFRRMMSNIKTAGLITLNQIDEGILDKISSHVPLVQLCDYDVSSDKVSSVSLDDVRAATSVMDYFASLGRKRIAFLSGPLQYKDNLNRKAGYLKGLSSMNVEPNGSWIVHLPEINYEMALSTATQILSQPKRPDGFFAISDLFASAVINAARRLDLRVPDDLMVVGFDNVDYAIISTPTITTISTPKFQLGYMACEMLIDKIRNPKASTQHIFLEHELIIRESTTKQNQSPG